MSSCSRIGGLQGNRVGLRISWKSRIFLMKAGRSMEPVRRKECVGGGGRTKSLISRSATMR